MKKLIAIAVLLLIGSAASAATVQYDLEKITYTNTFLGGAQWTVTNDATVNPKFPGACTTCYGTLEGTGNPATAAKATVNTISNAVTVTGAGWHGGPQQGNEYDVLWDLTTTVGGNSVTKTSQTCTQIAGAFCGTTISEFGAAVLGTGTDPNGRDLVTVGIAGSALTIYIQRALSESPTSPFTQGYTLQFTASPVPVPAAVWLFGSALGLMGWMRRKAS